MVIFKKKETPWMLKIYKEQFEIKLKTPLKKRRLLRFDLRDEINDFFPNYTMFLKNTRMNYPIFSKRNQLVEVYKNICVKNVVLNLNDLTVNNWGKRLQLVIINNKRNQLFISFLKNFSLIRSFSTGYVLHFLEVFKKEMRKRLSSFVLLLKTIFTTIEKFFIKNFFIFYIRGTKKNFFKWLNFLKVKLKSLKIVFYLYSPSIKIGYQGIKKIKAIKRKMRKKYNYSEGLI